MAKINIDNLVQSVVKWAVLGALIFFTTISMTNKAAISDLEDNDEDNIENKDEVLQKLDMIYETNNEFQSQQVQEHKQINKSLIGITQGMDGLKENQRIIFHQIPTLSELEMTMMENNLRTVLQPTPEQDTLMTLDEMFN